MSIWTSFWSDESGAVLSAETALVATLGVIGASVGLKTFAGAVNEELIDVARAVRCLDQSYSVGGTRCCCHWTAGSEFRQEPVEKSLKQLNEQCQAEQQQLEERLKAEQAKPAPQATEPKKNKKKKKKNLNNEEDGSEDTSVDQPAEQTADPLPPTDT